MFVSKVGLVKMLNFTLLRGKRDSVKDNSEYNNRIIIIDSANQDTRILDDIRGYPALLGYQRI